MGFLCRNLALAPRHTKEAANKTLVRPQLEYATPFWYYYYRTQDSTGGEGAEDSGGDAGDGEIQEASAIRWTSLSGHLWRPTGSSPPEPSFTRSFFF